MITHSQIKLHCSQKFQGILFLAICLYAFVSYSQIENPNAHTFQPIYINNGVYRYTNQAHQATPLLPPNGVTADHIIQQNNQNTLSTIGYSTPKTPPSDPYLRDQYIRQNAQQETLNKQKHYLAEIYQILNETLPEYQNSEEPQQSIKTKNYRDVFLEIQNMQNGNTLFSLKRAIFLIENAWYDNTLDYQIYCSQIDREANFIKKIALESHIEANNDLGYNYIIQKLFSAPTQEYTNGKYQSFSYDFDDFMGEQDWSKMFVSKLLNNGKGQCHSLPLLYLILAEETETKAWLAFAPEHSYIIFGDHSKHQYYNFETTNGNLVSNDWIMESGYISTPAIRNRIYLDTLGTDQLISTLVADLAMGYTNKYGYDSFVNSMIDYLLQLNPKNIQGHILKADLQIIQTKYHLKKVGNPPIQEIHLYPDANKSYTALLKEYEIIDALGYTPMPKEIYESWLSSANAQQQNAPHGK